jgi:putative SOS response-associated peptidase YedK
MKKTVGAIRSADMPHRIRSRSIRPYAQGGMCGRVDIHTPPSQLARMLEVQLAAGVNPEGRPSWNVPPARGIPAITERHPHTESGEKSEDPERVLDVLRWGLVPHWAKDPRTGYKMINARAETVTKKPAYRSAFANHRCLIVVDGFFEWQVPDPDSPKRKVPFYFRRADGQPLTFAGLYETWWDKSRSAEPDPETMLRTCTIITTNAGADMVDVHDRMPVIIERSDFDRWLDPDQHDTEALAKLLLPAPKGTLVRHPVDKAVNSPRNDGPMIIQNAPPDEDDAE